VLGYEDTINCSLKHIFQVFINYNIRWAHLESLSLAEWLNKYPLTNIDVSLNSPHGLSNVPAYFAQTGVAAPGPEEFKDWPLTLQYRERVTHLVEKPKFMQPKQNQVVQLVDNFLVSPRMLIRKASFTLEETPFCDSFNFDYKLTFEQLDSLPGQPFRTKIKSEYRVNIIKPIKFLQNTVVRETELSLKDTYAKAPYKDELFNKIIDLQQHMKHRWALEVKARQAKKAVEQDSGIAAIPEPIPEPVVELPLLP